MRRLIYYVIQWEDSKTRELLTAHLVSKATYYRYKRQNKLSEKTRFYDFSIYHVLKIYVQ